MVRNIPAKQKRRLEREITAWKIISRSVRRHSIHTMKSLVRFPFLYAFRRCKKGNSVGETVQHITAGCSQMANNSYLGCHNQVTKIVHRYLASQYRLNTCKFAAILQKFINFLRFSRSHITTEWDCDVYYNSGFVSFAFITMSDLLCLMSDSFISDYGPMLE